jgi:hypothetical protein
MCDPSAVRNWLAATLAGMLIVVAIIIGAIVANSIWYYAFAAPGVMISAALATGAALFCCNQAINALNAFCNCAGRKCAGQCGNLRNTLIAMATVLGIQATACLAAAAPAWIPGVGQAPMYVIIGALLIQIALAISALAFLSQLGNCQTVPVPGGGGPGAGPTV